MKFTISPIFRIAVSLILITTSLLMSAEFFGLLPGNSELVMDQRKKVSEALAVQFSRSAQIGQFDLIASTMESVVRRNDDILSSTIRAADGKVIAQAGDHEKNWQGAAKKGSTPTHVRVPIFHNNLNWGTVEISFKPLRATGVMGIPVDKNAQLVLFVAVSGFIAFFFFMRKVLRHLAPSTIIPARVQIALDALPSGVVLMDHNERVVLVNKAFSKSTGRSIPSLLGRRISKMGWLDAKTGRKASQLPWLQVVRNGKEMNGVTLKFIAPGTEGQIYVTNSSPILAANGKSRGAMVSFDDVTEIQQNNADLKNALTNLQATRQEVDEQNKKLQVLATRDPLTSCLNRRAFFESFKDIFEQSKQTQSDLACIMIDIDHFKAINDNNGHQVGDQVIKALAKVTDSALRSDDLLCRYGGEEFCVLLPGLSIAKASDVADRLRYITKKKLGVKLRDKKPVTISVGVTAIEFGAADPAELVNQADRALYQAKRRGRNRVERWSTNCEAEMLKAEAASAAETPRVSTAPDKSEDPVVRQLYDKISELQDNLSEQIQETEHRHSHDQVTGLPGHELFIEKVGQEIVSARQSNSISAVLSLETNIFKRVSDTLGSAAGEELLLRVSERLTDSLRDIDTVAALGLENGSSTVSLISADEFGVMLAGLEDVSSVEWVVKRIMNILQEPVMVGDNKLYLRSKIGISTFPADGEDADTLINRANMARFVALKESDEPSYSFYSEDMTNSMTNDIKLESQLRDALENDELVLHYQPIVDMETGNICSLEALVRWQSPDQGMVPPNDFIPIAEKTGIIVDLGRWVIRESCAQVKRWHEQGFTDLRIAVNVSSRQLKQKGMAAEVFSLLEEYELEARHLEIEITERAIVDCMDGSNETIMALYKHGIRISIDDFGTGYSALNYLKNFPVDTLKIDRSFVSDIPVNEYDKSIVMAIIDMARGMNLRVIAEGVENEDQLRAMQKLRCDEVQGFLFSQPLPGPEATVYLKKTRDANGVDLPETEDQLPAQKMAG